MFRIPLEVSLELMDDDCDDRNAEASAERYDSDRIVSCPNCGARNLKYVDTKHGVRLVYHAAPKSLAHIIGKIHACQDA